MMNRDHAQAIVRDIRALWEVATPPSVIARRLHLPERLVCHVINTGALPQDIRKPHWRKL